MPWQDVERDAQAAARVRWPRIKAGRRALEKVFRSYGGDAGRLLDCCRGSVVYVGLDGVRTGLTAILADPEAKARTH